MSIFALSLLVACSGNDDIPITGEVGGSPAVTGGSGNNAKGGASNNANGGTTKSSNASKGGATASSSSTKRDAAGGKDSAGGTTAKETDPEQDGGESNSTTARGGSQAEGGNRQTGGTSSTNGSRATGGRPATTGGTTATGGRPATTGGTTATGGRPPTGGTTATGGMPPTGGAPPTGGSPPTGGRPPTGGAPPTGGTTAANTGSSGKCASAVSGGQCPSPLSCPSGASRCGCYTFSGLGATKKEILDAGGDSRFMASAMVETENLKADYAHGDNKSGDAFNAGRCKQNWYMIRQCHSAWSGKGQGDYETASAMNTDLKLDIQVYNECRAKWSESVWYAGHRNGQTGLQTGQAPNLQLFINAAKWTQTNLENGHMCDDVRFWAEVPAIVVD